MALAAEPALTIGDAAPKLQVGKWVQGEPVEGFQKGKAYLLDFWATSSLSSRTSIPRLNEIQREFKDKGLIVIGQNCGEQDDNLVAPFVSKMGGQMTYRVALDNKQGNRKGLMAQTWMNAADRHSLPCEFLVDRKGRIAWIGRLTDLKDKIIEDVLADRFDMQKAAEQYNRQRTNEARLLSLSLDVNRSLQGKHWDEAMARVDEMAKFLPEDQRDSLDLVRFNILLGKKSYAAAYKLAAQFSESHKDDTVLQNELAWKIATDKTIERRDLPLAETIAARANAAAKNLNPGALDTLARIWFMEGKKDQAIRAEEKAVELAEGNVKGSLQKTLETYKKGQLPGAGTD